MTIYLYHFNSVSWSSVSGVIWVAKEIFLELMSSRSLHFFKVLIIYSVPILRALTHCMVIHLIIASFNKHLLSMYYMTEKVQNTGDTKLTKTRSLPCFPGPSQPNQTNCNLWTPPMGGDKTLAMGYKLNFALRFKWALCLCPVLLVINLKKIFYYNPKKIKKI